MKSTLVFSPNTVESCRRQVCELLQVKETVNPGNYPGLPMYIGRRKNNAFKFLKDRVSQKLQNWNNKSISKGGQVCNEIQRIMNSFWWGNKGGTKGIRWMSWERLCEGKFNGGLGFKDLKQFSVAMLAKQGWRLLTEEHSLVSVLMKAKYFPTANFLNAKLGNNPSYMWRSILESQTIVKQGSRRMIGNGEDTEVWSVPWLPCVHNGYITTSVPHQLKDAKVMNLINEDRDS
ncbi:putative mitochondrial protein AtMg00310 [Apium graveolens]|uniref:putative mitochondrial protein AtMg00310 n=1 Tax=Apium graveolens TaxID=4045 RepID=UPI003D7B989B